MRIDDENKAVWCSEANDLAFVDNKTTLVLIEQLIKFDGSYSLCELQDNYYESSNDEKLDLLYAILNNYTFKLEQPQKYYWRKKREHIASFEDVENNYFNYRIDQKIMLADNHSQLSYSGYKTEFTEQQARDLLKDDFDKFEKVECE